MIRLHDNHTRLHWGASSHNRVIICDPRERRTRPTLWEDCCCIRVREPDERVETNGCRHRSVHRFEHLPTWAHHFLPSPFTCQPIYQPFTFYLSVNHSRPGNYSRPHHPPSARRSHQKSTKTWPSPTFAVQCTGSAQPSQSSTITSDIHHHQPCSQLRPHRLEACKIRYFPLPFLSFLLTPPFCLCTYACLGFYLLYLFSHSSPYTSTSISQPHYQPAGMSVS